MNWKARMQAWATLVAALALPLLYAGGRVDVLALSVVGTVLFTGSLLVCPALRFVRSGSGKPPKEAAAPAQVQVAAARR